MTTPISGIDSQQAQALISLMREQAQITAIQSLLDDGTGSSSSSGSTDSTSFDSLLSLLLLPEVNGAVTGTTPDSLSTATSTASNSPSPQATPTLASPSASITSDASGSNSQGAQIASVALQLAGDLRGYHNLYYDPATTPAQAQAAFNTPCWGNGNIQCVAFVDGVYQQAGIPLPAAPNAVDFWSAYAHRAGWTEVPNGQGLPQPGDIIVQSGGAEGFGHVAVVTAVTPPHDGQPGQLQLAQANAPTSTATLTINASGQVQVGPGYHVLGFIRPQS
jgi:CHAP domain